MKKTIKMIMVIIVMIATNQTANAQWNTLNPPFGQTNLGVPGVGVGWFPVGGAGFLAALHVNSFYTWPTGNFGAGELFRTEATDAQINAWRMFNGPAVGGTSEKFSVQVFPVGGTHNGSSTSGYQVSLSAPVANDEIWMENNQMGLWTGNRPYIFMSENFGGTPDVINIGDGGQTINTTLFADDLIAGTWHRGLFQRGDNGNLHIGNWMSDYPVLNNVQMDVIGKAISQTSITPFRDFDCVFKGRISDDTSSFIRLANATNTDLQFVPMIHGHFDNQTADYKMGLAVLGSINPVNDVYVMGVHPVMDFDVRTYDPIHGNPQGVTRRDLFRWRNFATNEMLMDSAGRLGLRTITPKNRLEIDAQVTDPYSGSISGQSGLRLTKMLANSNTLPNPGSGVLSVDSSGDVIYVPGGGGANNGLSLNAGITVLGNKCGDLSQPAKLLSTREVPMGDFSIMFKGKNVPFGNRIGIGVNTGCLPEATLHVKTESTLPALEPIPTSLLVYNSATAFPGIYSSQAIGINDTVIGNNKENIGMQVSSMHSRKNYGFKTFEIVPPPGFGANYGYYGEVSNANNNTAFWGLANSAVGSNTCAGFDAIGATSGTNIGMEATAYGSSVSNFGISAYAPISTGSPINYAAYLDGDVWITGTAIGGSASYVFSDQQFKTNVDSITNALSILKQLKCKTYYLDTLNNYGIHFLGTKQYGLIAQQVEQVLPDLVKTFRKPADTDSTGNIIHPAVSFKALNYTEFIPILLRGVQELSKNSDSLKSVLTKQDSINSSLQHQIDSLKNNNSSIQNQLNDLRTIINNCCTANQNHAPIINNGNDKNNTSAIDVKLSDGQSVVLDQNVPNPFAEQTTINYFLPDNTGKAQMLFYNAGGKLIKSVELTERGQGQLNVFAEDLTNGMYTYTLVVDGKVMATKKMVKQ